MKIRRGNVTVAKLRVLFLLSSIWVQEGDELRELIFHSLVWISKKTYINSQSVVYINNLFKISEANKNLHLQTIDKKTLQAFCYVNNTSTSIAILYICVGG